MQDISYEPNAVHRRETTRRYVTTGPKYSFDNQKSKGFCFCLVTYVILILLPFHLIPPTIHDTWAEGCLPSTRPYPEKIDENIVELPHLNADQQLMQRNIHKIKKSSEKIGTPEIAASCSSSL